MNEFRYEKLGDNCELCVSDDHTFGTDAFLLADFAQARKKDTVCDLGTGCGIIAVLIKLRYGSHEIYGVDIQKKAIEQFETTVKRSALEDIHPVLMDLKELSAPLPLGKADLVTCNPPYKAAKAGIESLSEAQRIARHEIMCDIGDVCRAAAKLLRFGGRFCMCNRPERLADAVCAMRENGIEPKRLRFVSKAPDTAPWLFLIEGRRGGSPFMKTEPQLYMGTNGISPELMKIYGN